MEIVITSSFVYCLLKPNLSFCAHNFTDIVMSQIKIFQIKILLDDDE